MVEGSADERVEGSGEGLGFGVEGVDRLVWIAEAGTHRALVLLDRGIHLLLNPFLNPLPPPLSITYPLLNTLFVPRVRLLSLS